MSFSVEKLLDLICISRIIHLKGVLISSYTFGKEESMDFDKRIPIYQQLQDHFKLAFVRGEYQPGQSLPSRRELAMKLNVNPNTVQRAFKEMEEAQLIITEPNVASRMTEDAQVLAQLKHSLMQDLVEQFHQQLSQMNVPLEDAIDYLKDYEQNKGGNPHA